LPLVEEFVRSGNRLFRWRSYLPLALVALFLVAMRGSAAGDRDDLFAWWKFVCLAVSFVGFAIRAYTVGHAPRGTSGRNTRTQVAETLNTTGIYSTVRHPLYLGNFFMALGVSLYAALWWLALIFVLVFWLYYERIMFAEEAFLQETFGEEYMAWAAETPAFIPNLRQYRTSDLPFSIRNVLRREYNGVFAVVVAMFSLEVVRVWSPERGVAVGPSWIWIVGVTLVFWVVSRSVKRHTTWLDVAGR